MVIYRITPGLGGIQRTANDPFGSHELAIRRALVLGVPTLEHDWSVVD